MGASIFHPAPGGDAVQLDGALELLEEHTFPGNATNFDFTATIDPENDNGYIVEYEIDVNANGSFRLRLNGATAVAITLGSQEIRFADTTDTSFRGSAPANLTPLSLVSTDFFTGRIELPFLKKSATVPRAYLAFSVTHQAASGARMDESRGHIGTPINTAEITSIGVEGTGGNGIKAGSVVRLWRRN